jgi:hypothetical protein
MRSDPPRSEHPEPCPSPVSPFAEGEEVVIVSRDRWAASYGTVVGVDRCGMENGRHVAIGECAVDVGRSRVMWFRFDELAPSELQRATSPERTHAGRNGDGRTLGPGTGTEALSSDLTGR